MKRFKYVGPFDEVEVDRLGITVKQGEMVEVLDPDLSAGLEGQDSWEHIPDPERSKAAKKAAAERSDDDSQEG